MTHAVNSELTFLQRDDLYNTVKPYSLRYDPPGDIPRHNLQTERKQVQIHDARDINPSLEGNGFMLTSIPSKMDYEDFRDEKLIETVYAKELEGQLKSQFGASAVKVIDYNVKCPIRIARLFDDGTRNFQSQLVKSTNINSPPI
ncbi:hypothetical protein NW762_011729 [Fusarium torreyae]|uniref:Uncharacterized protein n=1 Tax=Fusarium torreyae TaxID=1237075 RepID=A0A9W8RPA8_9HYPO|nr:hypothetical protein NW762_011729 [Fusarium torreyae]